MVNLGYGCYIILYVAQQLYIASGKGFIMLAFQFLLGIDQIKFCQLNSKHKVDSRIPSFVVCHSAASVTRGSQIRELVHLVQLYK